jgi:hypothetical protein
MLSDRELATVLAALRYWQREVEEDAEMRDGLEGHGHFTEEKPLTVAEIDALCERLNCSKRPLVTIEVRGGVAEYEASDGVDVVLHDYDDCEEG